MVAAYSNGVLPCVGGGNGKSMDLGYFIAREAR